MSLTDFDVQSGVRANLTQSVLTHPSMIYLLIADIAKPYIASRACNFRNLYKVTGLQATVYYMRINSNALLQQVAKCETCYSKTTRTHTLSLSFSLSPLATAWAHVETLP